MKKLVFIIFILLSTITSVNALDTSHSSIVMDLKSGRILYENNANEKRLIASTTKIMTAIITLENIELEKKIVVGEEVLKMYGTNIYIEVGEELKIKDILYGLLLRSGNDAAVVLANNVTNTEEEFITLMNEKAQELGMKDTIFENPHGLDEETQNYSTAHDMALLSKYAMKNKNYRKIVKTKKYTTKSEEKTYLWYNRNKLLTNYEFCTGGKNGYTPDAGKTLVTTASKNNLDLTIVTLDDPNEYETHKNLYEQMYSLYQNYTIIDKNNFTIDKNIYNGDVYLKESFQYPLTEEETEKIKTEVYIKKNKEKKSTKIGNIIIKLNNKKIGELDIYEKTKKEEKKTLFQKIKELFL